MEDCCCGGEKTNEQNNDEEDKNLTDDGLEDDIFEEEADKLYCDISNIGVLNKSKRKIIYISSH